MTAAPASSHPSDSLERALVTRVLEVTAGQLEPSDAVYVRNRVQWALERWQTVATAYARAAVDEARAHGQVSRHLRGCLSCRREDGPCARKEDLEQEAARLLRRLETAERALVGGRG